MTNNKNNVTNNTNIQSLQFENGKHIFSIFYAPGMFAKTSWALYKDNIYKPFNHNIKEVVRKAEDNGWVVFNYTSLPDSYIWYPEANPVDILNDYHLNGMKTLEIALKYGISRDEVLTWLEKEANGELDDLFKQNQKGANPDGFYKDIIKGHLDDILTICGKGGVDVNHQVECITLLLENWEEK